MTDHDINKLLAEVAGVEVRWHTEGSVPMINEGWVDQRSEEPEIWDWWNPLTDHNQMASVEAGLREQGWNWEITQYPDSPIRVDIWKDTGPICEATHKDKLRAMAEAVVQMKEWE